MILLDDLLAGAAAAGARVAGPVPAREFQEFAYDSRNVRGGEMFVAVRTARADGHDHILDACRRGAAGVLCERLPDDAAPHSAGRAAGGGDPPVAGLVGATCVVVDDSRRALRLWAQYVMRRQAPLVIGVTGSVGKTCTTSAIAQVLRALDGDARTVFDNDNFNDLFGLPLSLSQLSPAHQTAVLELASDSAGEIAALCEMVAPACGVVTNVAPAHLEHFGSPARLAEEYGALPAAVSDWLFLNADDPAVLAMARRSALPAERIMTYGTEPSASARGTDVRPDADGTEFRLIWRGEAAAVRTPLLGRHSVFTALAAAAVALAHGYALAEVAAALGTLKAPPGRLRPLRAAAGSTLLDDTFSASLPSTLAALDALATLPPPRLVVLSGETGDAETLGAPLARVASHLVAMGDAAEAAARAAVTAGLAPECLTVTHTVEDTVAAVRSLAGGGDNLTPPAVLVKGTEAARLERVVERLLANPAEAPRLLVRQAPGAKQVVPLHLDRAAWMEVDLGAIAGNLRRLREIAAPAGVMAVLKADAYGHGAVRVARTAVQHGAAMLATAVLAEAATLRAHGVAAPILVLGYTPAWQARDVVRLGVAVSLFSLDAAQHLSRAAVAMQRPPVPVHIKVDTGMHRLGLLPEEVVPLARQVAALPGVRIEGLFTHFATADDPDPAYALEQLRRFNAVLDSWRAAALPRPQFVHAANSAATLRFPEARFDLVRTGIALYGLAPGPEVPLPEGFAPALALKTQLAQVKRLPAGEPVSYGATWVTPRESRIGVLPIGYADGFRRAPRNWGHVLVRGQRAPIVGRVCMDMCMVDVTDVPEARDGDEVVLIGTQGGVRLTAEEVAAQLGTISYEVVSQILARVPREIVSR